MSFNSTSFYSTRLSNLASQNAAVVPFTVSIPTAPTTNSFSDLFTISNTSVSTSLNTGALIMAGGMGIVGNANVGDTITVLNTADSTSISTGSVILSGGLGLTGALTSANFTTTGALTVLNTTPSISQSTGSLVSTGSSTLTGVLTVSGSVFTNGSPAKFRSYLAGTDITLTSLAFSSTSTNQAITITNTTVSTSVSTGALIVNGNLTFLQNSGVGMIVKNLSVQGNIDSYFQSPGTTEVDLVGNVGIGKTPSSFPLDIGTSFSATIAASHGFLTSTTTGGNSTVSNSINYSANFEGGLVAGGEIDVISDIRNKENIVSLTGSESLERIKNLRPVFFSWKDTIRFGTKPVSGFIAQEVDTVFPFAIQKHENMFVSDIFKKTTYLKRDGFIKLLDCDYVKDKEVISFYLEEDSSQKSGVIRKDENGIFLESIYEFSERGNIFLYGRLVDDFHTLDYTQLIPLLVSGNKALFDKNKRIKNMLDLLSN